MKFRLATTVDIAKIYQIDTLGTASRRVKKLYSG